MCEGTNSNTLPPQLFASISAVAVLLVRWQGVAAGTGKLPFQSSVNTRIRANVQLNHVARAGPTKKHLCERGLFDNGWGEKKDSAK